jgi:hypothetical protein
MVILVLRIMILISNNRGNDGHVRAGAVRICGNGGCADGQAEVVGGEVVSGEKAIGCLAVMAWTGVGWLVVRAVMIGVGC